MKTHIAVACLMAGALLGPVVAVAGEDADSVGSSTMTFVKDSAITTEVKSKLAMEHLTSLGRIHVDTDKNGIVYLSGTARTPEAIDKAMSIARGTEHVRGVHSTLTVRQDD